MGFLSFHETYYMEAVQRFESRPLSPADVYEAKQLLKMLDDLMDEGYTALNDYLESKYSCLSRLRRVIKNAGDEPFKINRGRLPETTYSSSEHELLSVMKRLQKEADFQEVCSKNAFLADVRDYCGWIGHEEETAYIFLFRDSLLPYLYYRSRGRKHLYAWIISRSFLRDVSGVEDIDDAIRLPVYEALEYGHISFDDYRSCCKEQILAVLERHGLLKDLLSRLLSSVKEKRIVVVESGYCGTMPMMLSALDDRVTFKLYTTAPYLYETYKNHVYCKRYEDIRKFETLYSQNLLLRYSSFRENQFYVTIAESQAVWKQALMEMKYFTAESPEKFV